MTSHIAVIDNHDSFSHNLEQYVGEFAEVTVGRFDEPPDADGYVFSPGPGHPDEFPVMYDILRDRDEPVLGVCLGHQAVVKFFGGSVGYADEVVHGKRSPVEHDGEGVFDGISSPTPVARYHSLVVDDVPDRLEVTARGAGEVMGVRHHDRPVFGVQFHPESFLTPEGKRIVGNFVRLVEER
ncbi:MAG: anthranilate synthase component II [Halobacteriales archaeon]